MMRSAYIRLAEAAEDFDFDRLDRIYKEMEGYSIPAEEEELWGRVKAAVRMFDYDKTVQLIREHEDTGGDYI